MSVRYYLICNDCEEYVEAAEMSVRYYLICNDYEKYTEVAKRSYRGRALTPTSKVVLASFIVTHSNHKVEIISEYDARLDNWQYKEWAKDNMDEIYEARCK